MSCPQTQSFQYPLLSQLEHAAGYRDPCLLPLLEQSHQNNLNSLYHNVHEMQNITKKGISLIFQASEGHGHQKFSGATSQKITSRRHVTSRHDWGHVTYFSSAAYASGCFCLSFTSSNIETLQNLIENIVRFHSITLNELVINHLPP